MVGEKHNIPEYMNAMDVFCLSSITEGFPNVIERRWHLVYLV